VRFADFSTVSAKVFSSGNKVYITFEGLPEEKSIQFEPANKKTIQEWVNTIGESIKTNGCANKHYTYLATHDPDFYKSKHISNANFEMQVNTGDVLLFKSKHTAAKAQQIILNSEYGTHWIK
jgi:hypothetical protein